MDRPLRILSNDDDEGIRALLFHLLTEQGHEVELARNSDDVFKNLGRAKYDLLILDVNTPGINGYKVAEKICANIINRPRILIFTARNIEAEKAEFTLCGADAIIRKGTPCDKILGVIKDLFSEKGAAAVPASLPNSAPKGADSYMEETEAKSSQASEKLNKDLQSCLFKITLMEDAVNFRNMRYEGFIRDLLKEKQRTEKNYLEFKRIEEEVISLKNLGYAVAAAAVLSVIRSFL